MKCRALVWGLAALAVLAVARTTEASYIYSWSATPQISDPVDNVLLGSRDVVGVWVGNDADYVYFRMDLRAAPEYAGTNYAGIYGIYIDAIPAAGADYTSTSYVPFGLTGIDYVIDSHFAYGGSHSFSTAGNHFHTDYTEANGFTYGSVDGVQTTENSGKTLEWKIARSKLGDPSELTFWAGTIDDGSANATYDLAPNSVFAGYTVPVPEPGTLALAAMATAMGWVGLRRKR